MQVLRGGRIVKISIFDIVVGDIVPLKIGDQVRNLIVEFVLQEK
jgi:Ca2+-transporting ATPase